VSTRESERESVCVGERERGGERERERGREGERESERETRVTERQQAPARCLRAPAPPRPRRYLLQGLGFRV